MRAEADTMRSPFKAGAKGPMQIMSALLYHRKDHSMYRFTLSSGRIDCGTEFLGLLLERFEGHFICNCIIQRRAVCRVLAQRYRHMPIDMGRAYSL